ncbi:MAG: leucine-rich repeat protein [Eubacteriales bacterium]|nr:leucine-rich repeat protein [Eubacteriales bacterium]
MTSLQLLNAIGDIESKYILEAQAVRVPRPRRRASKWKVLLIAAAMAVLLAGCTYAVLKLQDLKIDEYTPTVPNRENAAHDVISLQGYAGSPGYLAAKEWRAFKAGLDPEGQPGFQAADEYYAYSCTSQEMVDKVDVLCEKYGLQLLGQSVHRELSHYELFPALGIEDIFRPGSTLETALTGGYYYTDGSFQLSGTAKFTEEAADWPYPMDFRLRCVKKQSFDAACLDIGQIADYDQWEYTAASGQNALLALGPAYGLILVDNGDSFLTVAILNAHVEDGLNGAQQMTRENLQALADDFDLRLKTSPVPDLPRKTQESDRYMTVLGLDPQEFEGTRLVCGGRTYVFRAPTAGIGFESSEYLGVLSYDPEYPANDLTTDSTVIHGAQVTRLTGGSLGDALLVGPEIGRKLLYVPEDVRYSSDFEYLENGDGTITLTKYRGDASYLELPSQIDGKAVTRIGHIGQTGDGAFSCNPHLVELVIPEGVTLVDDCTFWGCYRLRTVRFPASLTGLGHSVFNECPMLTDLWFEGSAPAHGNYLFDFYPQDLGLPKVKLHYYQGTAGWEGDSLWSNFEHNVTEKGETE